MKRVVIVGAKRTPLGKFRGALAKLTPVELGVAAAAGALDRVGPQSIDQIFVGNVFAAGHGMNIARQIGVRSGVPLDAPATTVNVMCGSGMQAALLGAMAIRAGESRVCLVGGTESMSQAGLLVPRPEKGQAPDVSLAVDTMLRDGLRDTFGDRHMGEQAESLAAEFGIGRDAQDRYALRSQRLQGLAARSGWFEDEIVPVGGLASDQHPRPDSTLDELAALKTPFLDGGSVTAGNSSGINDGAAMLVLAEESHALVSGWPILARWVDGVIVGCEPERMGLGPVLAIKRLFERTGSGWGDVDKLEINEAFAAQTLACLKGLGLSTDFGGEGFGVSPESPTREVTAPGGRRIPFNSEGGAIAIGHPLAASGARLLVHLAWQIRKGRSRCGVGALCIGGGMGIAAMLSSAAGSVDAG